MTDKSCADHAAAYEAWAEARIDCLLAALFEQSRELATLAGEDVFVRAQLGHAINTIERLQRDLARKDAEIARMRTDPARRPTRTESIVRGLNALYKAEGE